MYYTSLIYLLINNLFFIYNYAIRMIFNQKLWKGHVMTTEHILTATFGNDTYLRSEHS